MKHIALSALSIATLLAAASPALALSDRFDDARQGTINKLNDQFDDARQGTINKLNDRFGDAYEDNLNR